MTARVFVGVGSSVAPEAHVPRALACLDDAVGVLAVSAFYLTPALERPADPPFVNGVVEVRALLAPAPLKALLGRIEDRVPDAHRPASPVRRESAMVRIKRAYEEPATDDGYRVLVDRLWPRGVKKQSLRLDLWAKDLAPSPDLRIWFGHDPERFHEFARRYHGELRAAPARALLAELARRAAHGSVTLVYAARDEEHNGAVVLRDAIDEGPRAHAR